MCISGILSGDCVDVASRHSDISWVNLYPQTPTIIPDAMAPAVSTPSFALCTCLSARTHGQYTASISGRTYSYRGIPKLCRCIHCSPAHCCVPPSGGRPPKAGRTSPTYCYHSLQFLSCATYSPLRPVPVPAPRLHSRDTSSPSPSRDAFCRTQIGFLAPPPINSQS
jgi:hypothetical protein